MFALLIVSAGMFGAIFCVGYLLVNTFDRHRVLLNARLRDSESAGDAKENARVRGFFLNPSKSKLDKAGTDKKKNELAAFGRKHDISQRQRVQSRLLHAGIYHPIAMSLFFAVKLALMIVPPVLGWLAGEMGMVDIRIGLLWGTVVGGCGMFLPSIWLERQVRRRHRLLKHSLPDFLDLMTVCLQSGLSVQGTLERVTEELKIAHPLLAGELKVVQRDIELGATMDAAMRRFSDRSGYEEIRSLSTFIRESQRFGTDLSEAMRLHADSLRNQREQSAEESAQKAAVKILLPTLLLILPAVFVVVAGPAVIKVQQAFAKSKASS